MPERGFKTITVSTQLYQQVQREKAGEQERGQLRPRGASDDAHVEDKFANYVPFLQLISIDNDEVIMRDDRRTDPASRQGPPAPKGEMGASESKCAERPAVISFS